MFATNESFTAIEGPAGTLPVAPHDIVARRLLMLVEGQCGGGAPAAARRFGYTRQRYSQLLHAYRQGGSEALCDHKRGPKTHYRRTGEVVRDVIRMRFLDPDASPAVIAQKLRQMGRTISTRSVERVIAENRLQKKTSPVVAAR
jgi:hypothetical protein